MATSSPNQLGSEQQMDTRSSQHGLERFGFQARRRSSEQGSEATQAVAESVHVPAKQPTAVDVPCAQAAVAKNPYITERRTVKKKEIQLVIETPVEPKAPPGPVVHSPKAVVWEAFTNTEQVVAAFREFSTESKVQRHELAKSSRSSESQEGSLQLSKDQLGQLRVIGQFNMGFILACSPDNHLWVLDQHACDEINNFERLYRDTVLREQPLIQPMPIELSPAEEVCVLDNMTVFEENGFRFRQNPEAAPGSRLSLTSVPHSGARDGRKAVQFGKEDVSALCSILGAAGDDDDDVEVSGGTGVDGSGMYGNNAVRRYTRTSSSSSDQLLARLPKAVAMFASRACRSSVMIGQALSDSEMSKIVGRLVSLDQPWSCPHGRPTMQHVADLQPILQRDADRSAEHAAQATLTVLSQEESNSDGQKL